MRVALFQNDPPFGEVERNLDAAGQALAGVRADLVILPELFATGYQFVDRAEVEALAEPVPGGKTTSFLERLARESGATVVAGLAERAERGADASGRFWNAAAVVSPDGWLTTYRKLHLFDEEKLFFAPGEGYPPVVEIAGGARIGVMICFDWRFPEVARYLAIEGADLVAHPSNLVLHDTPDRILARAAENRVFIATCDRVGAEARGGKKEIRYVGRSQVAGPRGERLVAASPDRIEVLELDLDPAAARDKRITARNDLLADRRSDLFPLRLGPSPAPVRRFVVQRHELPDGSHHFDLMLERAGVLLTFTFPAFPADGAEGRRIFDHRLRYLDFEGDLDRGKGAVAIADAGTYVAVAEESHRLTVELRGRTLQGRFDLYGLEADRWRLDKYGRGSTRINADS